MNSFRGNTEGCFFHFREEAQKRGDKFRHAALELQQHLDVPTLQTAQHWLNIKKLPQGPYLIKLRYFLQLKGYEVKELRSMDPTMRALGQSIFEKKFTMDEVIELLYAPNITKSSRDTLTAALHGRRPYGPEMLAKVRVILRKKSVEAGVQCDHLPQTKTESVQGPGPHGNVLLALLDPIENILHALLSDETTRAEREHIREEAREKIFEVSNLFSQLCSETTRNNAISTRRSS